MPLFSRKDLTNDLTEHIKSESHAIVASVKSRQDMEAIPDMLSNLLDDWMKSMSSTGAIGFKVDDITIEAVVRAVEAAYDSFISPLDVPYVPNVVIEPAFDAAVRMLIRPAVQTVMRRYRS